MRRVGTSSEINTDKRKQPTIATHVCAYAWTHVCAYAWTQLGKGTKNLSSGQCEVIWPSKVTKRIERRKWLHSYNHECKNTRIKKKTTCDPKRTIRMTQRKQKVNAKWKETVTCLTYAFILHWKHGKERRPVNQNKQRSQIQTNEKNFPSITIMMGVMHFHLH